MNEDEIKKRANDFFNETELMLREWGIEFQEESGIINCPICQQRTCGYQIDGKCIVCKCKIDHYKPKYKEIGLE